MPTLSERIVLSVGTGKDPAEITVLDTLDNLTATAAELNLNASQTATAAEVNARAATASRQIAVPDATPYTILAADSGKMFVLPDFTSTTTLNFPVGVAGMEYEFVSSAVAADAQNWVFTATAGLFMTGGVAWMDTDAGPAAAETKVVFANGSSHVTLTVVVPTGGTRLYFLYNGTKWIVNGIVCSITTPAFS